MQGTREEEGTEERVSATSDTSSACEERVSDSSDSSTSSVGSLEYASLTVHPRRYQYSTFPSEERVSDSPVSSSSSVGSLEHTSLTVHPGRYQYTTFPPLSRSIDREELNGKQPQPSRPTWHSFVAARCVHMTCLALGSCCVALFVASCVFFRLFPISFDAGRFCSLPFLGVLVCVHMNCKASHYPSTADVALHTIHWYS
jgi:hypothetical protein